MNYRLSILFSLLILCSLAACKQNYAVPNPPTNPPALNVVNATTDTLDYFINGTRQNNTSDIYPGGATYYLKVLFGTGNYSFKKAGSQVTLFSHSFTLDTATYYSLFVCGETSDKTFLLRDNYASATAAIDTSLTKAAVRFVNASPNAGALSIMVSIGSTVNLQSLAFQSASTFYALKDTVNDVKIYSGSTLLKDTTIMPIGGQIYTMFTKGDPKVAGKGSFSAVLIANATATIQ